MATSTFLLLLLFGQTILATQENQNWKLTLSAKIDGASVDQVWPLVEDFCNLYKIFPSDVSFCLPGKADGQPGQLRYSAGKYPSPSGDNSTVVLWAKEELLKIDAKERYVSYKILDNNRGLTVFYGNMQVLPPSDGGKDGCVFRWSVESAPVNGLDFDGFVATINGTLAGIETMIENLF